MPLPHVAIYVAISVSRSTTLLCSVSVCVATCLCNLPICGGCHLFNLSTVDKQINPHMAVPDGPEVGGMLLLAGTLPCWLSFFDRRTFLCTEAKTNCRFTSAAGKTSPLTSNSLPPYPFLSTPPPSASLLRQRTTGPGPTSLAFWPGGTGGERVIFQVE